MRDKLEHELVNFTYGNLMYVRNTFLKSAYSFSFFNVSVSRVCQKKAILKMTTEYDH